MVEDRRRVVVFFSVIVAAVILDFCRRTCCRPSCLGSCYECMRYTAALDVRVGRFGQDAKGVRMRMSERCWSYRKMHDPEFQSVGVERRKRAAASDFRASSDEKTPQHSHYLFSSSSTASLTPSLTSHRVHTTSVLCWNAPQLTYAIALRR